MFSNVPQGRGMWEQPSGPFEAARYKYRSYSVDLLRSIVKSMVKKRTVGSGCGSIGTAVASNTRDPQFESCNRQNLSANLSTNCIKEKTKIKKRPGMAHL